MGASSFRDKTNPDVLGAVGNETGSDKTINSACNLPKACTTRLFIHSEDATAKGGGDQL